MSHGRGNTNTFLGQGATAFNFRLGSRSLIKTVGCLVTDSEMQGIQIGEEKKERKKISRRRACSRVRTTLYGLAFIPWKHALNFTPRVPLASS